MKKFLFTALVFSIFSISAGCGHQDASIANVPSMPSDAQSIETTRSQNPLPSFSFASSDKTQASNALSDQRELIVWLRSVYGELPPSHPLFQSACDIFKRVMAVADKRSARLPELMIIQEAKDPWALCLEDGTVILTQKALEICYQNVDEPTGCARLAFIFGHELAHLAKDDFWEWKAFEMVKKYGSGQRGIQAILDTLTESEGTEDSDHARAVRKKKEIQADEYGLLFAVMAGYNPKAIVDDANGENFFQEWVDQITGKVAYTDDDHPEAEQRAAFLISYMNAVKNDLILFDIGVRLYQLAMFEDALSFLKAFQKKFPCREVFNNIGLVYYQLALESLTEYNQEKAYEWKLATLLDTETRAGEFRGSSGDPMDRFKEEIQKAIRNFEYACETDRFYVPARVNLSSALIMKGEYAKAAAISEEALELEADDPRALNNMAVARYLDMLNPSDPMNIYRARREKLKDLFAEEAIEVLRDIAGKHQGFSAPYYNIARILTQNGDDAGESWKKFLDIEPSGIYAKMVREAAGIKEKASVIREMRRFSEEPPVKIGEIDNKTEAQLDEMSKQTFELEDVDGEYYSGEAFQVLVLDGTVELVETSVKKEMRYKDVISEYGEPERVFINDVSNETVLVYEAFALDIQEGVTTGVAYFSRENN